MKDLEKIEDLKKSGEYRRLEKSSGLKRSIRAMVDLKWVFCLYEN